MFQQYIYRNLFNPLHVRFPVSGLSDGGWHHLAISVSTRQLAVYVDCALLESVDWIYHGFRLGSDGLLVIGGITDGSETTFEVSCSHSLSSPLPPLSSWFHWKHLRAIRLCYFAKLRSKPYLRKYKTPLSETHRLSASNTWILCDCFTKVCVEIPENCSEH